MFDWFMTFTVDLFKFNGYGMENFCLILWFCVIFLYYLINYRLLGKI
jgi:hypothetical protein